VGTTNILRSVTAVGPQTAWVVGAGGEILHLEPRDTTLPTTQVAGAAKTWYNTTSVTLNLTAQDPAGIALLEWSALQGAVSSRSLTAATAWNVGRVVRLTGEGVHTFQCRAIDNADNTGLARTVTVGIDTRRPLTKAAAATVIRGRTAALRCAVIDSAPCAGWARVKVWVKNSHGKLVKALTYAHLRTGVWFLAKFRCTLAKGTYRYYVYATDGAGNTQSKVGWNKLVVK
jgi:hypothetical protein